MAPSPPPGTYVYRIRIHIHPTGHPPAATYTNVDPAPPQFRGASHGNERSGAPGIGVLYL